MKQTQGRDAGQASKRPNTEADTSDPKAQTAAQERQSTAKPSFKLSEREDIHCSLRSEFNEGADAAEQHSHGVEPPCTPEQPQQTCFGRSDHEFVTNAYTRVSMLGIRSLPDALQPHFRERLFAELVAVGQTRRQQQRQKMSSNIYSSAPNPELAAALMPLLAHSTKGPPLQTQVAAGQMAPGERSALRSIFAVYQHKYSDYEAFIEDCRERRRKCVASRVSQLPFTATALPRPPPGATVFNGFTYMEDPFQRQDDMRWMQQKEQLSRRLAARYLPGGRAQQYHLSKSSLDACLLQLHTTLSHDWPASFVQVFEDIPGCLVLSFHKHLAALEGDITTYMNQHYRTDITVQSFKLAKDTVQWAVTTDNGDPELEWGVFFVYWPPWATRPKLIPDHLAGPRPSQDAVRKQVGTQGLPSRRTPFGARTNAGMLTATCTRSHEHTMVNRGGTLLGRM